MRQFFILLVLGLGLLLPGWAEAQTGASVEVEHPWARATLAGAKTGAVYLTLINKGSVDDSVVEVSTPVAASAQIHQETVDNGIIKMRPVGALKVKAGGKVTLEPGKYHVMLMGLKAPLQAGQSFPLTLRLQRGGVRRVAVEVESATSAGAMGDMGKPGGMQMGK